MRMFFYKMYGGESYYTDSQTGERRLGTFLTQKTVAFYHDCYHAGDQEKRVQLGTIENVITTLKNQFGNTAQFLLNQVGEKMIEILSNDLPEILQMSKKKELLVCVVPRSKRDISYTTSQLLFKKT